MHWVDSASESRVKGRKNAKRNRRNEKENISLSSSTSLHISLFFKSLVNTAVVEAHGRAYVQLDRLLYKYISKGIFQMLPLCSFLQQTSTGTERREAEGKAEKDDCLPCWSFDTVFSSSLHTLQFYRSQRVAALDVMNAVQFVSFTLTLSNCFYHFFHFSQVHLHKIFLVQMRSRTNSIFCMKETKVVGIANVHMTCTQCIFEYIKRKGDRWQRMLCVQKKIFWY